MCSGYFRSVVLSVLMCYSSLQRPVDVCVTSNAGKDVQCLNKSKLQKGIIGNGTNDVVT